VCQAGEHQERDRRQARRHDEAHRVRVQLRKQGQPERRRQGAARDHPAQRDPVDLAPHARQEVHGGQELEAEEGRDHLGRRQHEGEPADADHRRAEARETAHDERGQAATPIQASVGGSNPSVIVGGPEGTEWGGPPSIAPPDRQSTWHPMGAVAGALVTGAYALRRGLLAGCAGLGGLGLVLALLATAGPALSPAEIAWVTRWGETRARHSFAANPGSSPGGYGLPSGAFWVRCGSSRLEGTARLWALP
jgi:hypothetical protein